MFCKGQPGLDNAVYTLSLKLETKQLHAFKEREEKKNSFWGS